jgi:hypothetical protein
MNHLIREYVQLFSFSRLFFHQKQIYRELFVFLYYQKALLNLITQYSEQYVILGILTERLEILKMVLGKF